MLDHWRLLQGSYRTFCPLVPRSESPREEAIKQVAGWRRGRLMPRCVAGAGAGNGGAGRKKDPRVDEDSADGGNLSYVRTRTYAIFEKSTDNA